MQHEFTVQWTYLANFITAETDMKCPLGIVKTYLTKSRPNGISVKVSNKLLLHESVSCVTASVKFILIFYLCRAKSTFVFWFLADDDNVSERELFVGGGK
jgi:hypothetical protein